MLDVPAGIDFTTQVIPAVLFALATNPPAAASMGNVQRIRIPVSNPADLTLAILHALFYQVAGTNDLLARTAGARSTTRVRHTRARSMTQC